MLKVWNTKLKRGRVKIDKVRGFEIVEDAFKKNNGNPKLPQCATERSAAYDFYAPINVIIEPMQSVMIWTDIKAYFLADEVLLINVRSSMGKQPVMLANTQGWIDADYYNNPENNGNIGIRLLNLGKTDYEIHQGDRIAQGMFIKTLKADRGNSNNQRLGGFGSTN